jgi:enoyl-CoA hydratase
VAKDMIFTGRRLGAGEALSIGLVDRVVPRGEALTGARRLASAIAAKGPVAVRHAKQAVSRALELDLASGLAYEANQFALLFATQDAREGTSAFVERREPRFEGR